MASIFERFLNPARVTMPDIDMDFGDTRRSEVVDYVRQKYGEDHVAQIVTFGTMAARAAIRDVGRVMNFTFAETDAVAKLVPTTLHITLKRRTEAVPAAEADVMTAMRALRSLSIRPWLLRACRAIPRHMRQAWSLPSCQSTIMCRLLWTNDGTIVTEHTMTTLEELGLLKMDFRLAKHHRH